jgi:hypothetical protein
MRYRHEDHSKAGLIIWRIGGRRHTRILQFRFIRKPGSGNPGSSVNLGLFLIVEDRPLPDHLIRLRGGWESFTGEGANAVVACCSLPLSGSIPASLRVRLFRRFGRPRLQSANQSLFLSLDHVPGLRSISLNGAFLAFDKPGHHPLEIFLESLSERNELVLDVEFPSDPDVSTRWGDIALVIRSRPEASA